MKSVFTATAPAVTVKRSTALWSGSVLSNPDW